MVCLQLTLLSQINRKNNVLKGTITIILTMISLLLILSFVFDNYIEAEVSLINTTDDTIYLFSDFEDIDNVIHKIESKDSLKIYEYNKFHTSSEIKSYSNHDPILFAFYIKNNKNQVMAFPSYINDWSRNIIFEKKFLYLSKIQIKYFYDITDSSFLDPKYKFEYSDTTNFLKSLP